MNQEKKYEQWLSKTREDVRKGDVILEKYAIKIKMLSDKLDKTNKMIGKMSYSFSKVETLMKIGKHPNDKRGLGYVNEKITPSSNNSTFVNASSNLNVGTLSNSKAMDATGGDSTSTRNIKGRTQQGQRKHLSLSNAKGEASRNAHQRGNNVRRPNALNAQAKGKFLKFIPICHYCTW